MWSIKSDFLFKHRYWKMSLNRWNKNKWKKLAYIKTVTGEEVHFSTMYLQTHMCQCLLICRLTSKIALIRTVTVTVFYLSLIVYSSCMYLSATFNLPVVSSLSHSFSNTTMTKVNTTGITTARVIWNWEDTWHITDILLSLHILKFSSVDTRIWNTNCHLTSATKVLK